MIRGTSSFKLQHLPLYGKLDGCCYERTEIHCIGWTSLPVSDGTEGNSLRVTKRIALANELERTRRVRGISQVTPLGWLQSRLKMGNKPTSPTRIYSSTRDTSTIIQEREMTR